MLLVGDGGAGKTSLVKRILNKGFDKNETQTDGIAIEKWVTDDSNLLLDDDNDMNDIKVHLWDFGGQEIMHAMHQFFLSKRSLYILVLDGRKDKKPNTGSNISKASAAALPYSSSSIKSI